MHKLCTTGNKLNIDHARETMVLSFSFLELGAEAMMSGAAWLTPVCLRSTAIDKAMGISVHIASLS
jgi:hypothetical protein